MRANLGADFMTESSTFSWTGLYNFLKLFKRVTCPRIKLQTVFLSIQQCRCKKCHFWVRKMFSSSQGRTRTHAWRHMHGHTLSILLKADRMVTNALLIKPKHVLIVLVFNTWMKFLPSDFNNMNCMKNLGILSISTNQPCNHCSVLKTRIHVLWAFSSSVRGVT